MHKSTEKRLNSNHIIDVELIEIMYTTCVQNLVCKYKQEFICYLCKTSSNDLMRILKHVQTDQHHQERKGIKKINNMTNNLQIDETKSVEIVLNSIILTGVNKFYCIICTDNIASLKDVHNHIKENSRHMKTKTNIMSLDEPISLIYKCQTCHLALKSDAEYKYHKMFHLSPERYACCNIDIINFSIQEDKTRFIHCSVCDQILFSEEELEKHVKTVTHHKWTDLFKRSKVFAADDILQQLINLDMIYKSTEVISFTKNLYCYVCELDTLNQDNEELLIEHRISKKHINKMSLFSQNEKFNLTFISANCFPVYICFICNIEFTEEKLIYNHYNSVVHQYRAKVLYEFANNKYINILEESKRNSIIKCTLCNVEVNDPQSMLSHIFGSKHRKKIKDNLSQSVKVVHKNVNVKSIIKNDCPKLSLTSSQLVPSKNKIKENLSLSVKVIDKNMNLIESTTTNDCSILSVTNLQLPSGSIKKSQFFCYICKANVPDFMIIQHLKSKKHMQLFNQIKNVKIESIGNKLFSCQTCEKSFSTDLQLIEHFRDDKHQDYTKIWKNNIIDSTDHKSFENTFTPENVNQNQNSDDLTSEVDNKIGLVVDKYALVDSENKKQDDSSLTFLNKEIKLRRPKKGFNPTKIGEKFIELFIESNIENIYNLEANLMYKMRLGITLSLPTKPERRYCIPCDQEMSSDLQIFKKHLHDENHKRNILEMVAKDKPHSSNLDDYLNDFRLACSYMRKSSENTVLCFACSIKIEPLDRREIYDHMNSKSHTDNCLPLEALSEKVFQNLTKTWKNKWYFAEKFFCDVCSVKCDLEIDFAEHSMQDQHVENVNQALIVGDALKHYMCGHCATYYLFCSKANFLTSHCKGSHHKRMLESQDYVIPPLSDSVRDIFNHLEDTIDSLVRDSEKINRDTEESLLQLLESITQKRYPEVKAYLLGSRLSRTNSDNSDMEIYLDCDNTYHEFTSAEKSRKRLLEIEKCLINHGKNWSIEDVNLTAKMPTIKLQLKAVALRCSIECGDGLNTEKSKLIRFFVDSYSTCRKLIIFLKKWLSLCRLSGTQGITDYAVSTLAIFYLQTENILPSLSFLIKQKNRSNTVAGWETPFLVEKITVPDHKDSAKDHLSRFFNFYANFNYITDVICPFLGRPAKKRDFVNLDNLPKEMNIYKRLFDSGRAEAFRFDSPMCVQDPLVLSENVTFVVTKLQLRMFRQYCLESKKMLDRI